MRQRRGCEALVAEGALVCRDLRTDHDKRPACTLAYSKPVGYKCEQSGICRVRTILELIQLWC